MGVDGDSPTRVEGHLEREAGRERGTERNNRILAAVCKMKSIHILNICKVAVLHAVEEPIETWPLKHTAFSSTS